MKKNKHSTLEAALEKSDLSDSFAENPIVQWISENGRNILWFLLVLLTLSILAYRFLSTPGGSISEYFAADREFNLFLTSERSETGANQAQESLNKLTKILKRHPELHAKYDGRIAQALIVRGDYQAALPFAERTLSRISDEHVPLYRNYASTTLLIEAQQYPQALEQATQLQATLNEKSALYAANLLRIATLNQKMGHNKEELQAWQLLKKTLTEPMAEAWQEGNISMLDYIAYREKEIGNF